MDKITRYKIRLEREKQARQEAENLLREKAHELHFSNEELKNSRNALKEENERRTYDLIRIQRLAKIASWRWDIKNGYILWSDEITSILELNEQEAQKKDFWRTIYYLKRCDKQTRHIIITFLRSIAQQTMQEHDSTINESLGLEHNMSMLS